MFPRSLAAVETSAEWVCLYDACPPNLARDRQAGLEYNARVIGGFIGLGIRWAIMLGALYLFVRWAAQ